MKPSRRIGIIHLFLAVFVVALLVKAARVQFWQRKELIADAVHQQSTSKVIPASRGDILDSRGETIAQSRETVKLAVAPRDVRDLLKLKRALLRAKVPKEWALRATDTTRKWVEIPGHYLAIDVATASAMRGVYTTPIVERAYSFSESMRRIVGRVDNDGNPVDGIELSLDSLLRGVPGTATIMRDVHGRRFDSPSAPTHLPTTGNTVVLTINQELQEIAERALADAVSAESAEGGDVVVLSPDDGSILAMASQRSDPRSTASTALTEPYEPGSTLKPLIAATLLQQNKARETDVVSGQGGRWKINGREITDEHLAPQFTLADVIRFSSNIGIVQFAMRLSPREEFEALRDFGFGSPTGVPYPVESPGMLRSPAKWSKQSANSLAMGYEISVTPLQLALAYVALANDGELLEPALVKEVRAPDGKVLYKHERRPVRRVVSPAVARRVRLMLATVVENGGTAKKADLASFTLAGKTGTARRAQNGHYDLSEHIPTFVGLFPGDNPQFVILVKLDNPKGAYMGGLTAAPVTKTLVEAALASRNASLNKKELAASRHERPVDTSAIRLTVATMQQESTTVAQKEAIRLAAVAAADDSAAATPFVALLPSPKVQKVAPLPSRAVPDVHGMPLRTAVHALHAAGFRVQLARGSSMDTQPAAGTLMQPGGIVQLVGTP